MGTVTSTTVIRSDGTVIYDTQRDHRFETREGDILSFNYAYSQALLPQPSDPRRGLWRYSSLLPIEDGPTLFPLPIGDTPLVGSAQVRHATRLPRLWLKDETKTPTGSNKDRATALVLEHALRHKIDVVTCASTGNVAVSLAVGAAAAGIKAVIFVASTVSEAKLKLMLLTGATVVKVAGGYEAAFALSRQAAHRFGWYERNTGINPLTLEAKKTLALEIWEQLGYRAPDAIVAPVGDGITLSGIVKGFRELQACGAIQHMPRVVGVQAEGCQPLKRAWENQATTVARATKTSQTIADGIAVDVPIGAALALKDIRESNGAFVAVSDHAMLQAIQLLAKTTGILAEPAAVAAFAGLTPALQAGLIKADDEIVVPVTGSGLKQQNYLLTDRAALNIGEDEKELERVLDAVRAL